MTGIEALLAMPVIAMLIAVLLYVATYLSYVRLLRYPRNWNSPSLPASLTTVVLASLTVLLVSFSPHGVDLSALIILVVSIAVTFFIIAAPAIAFRPASRLVEFLAKHGDYAGLWLIAPALLSVLVIPNIKLQAVLLMALAIEISWFLRLRWADRYRPLYPMSERDLSVLKTQADGDLVAFRRRHGIRELILSKESVGWRGCGKGTPACPFNLYVNQLGLNTAPCCREHMKVLSHYITTCLSEMEVVHWLEGGSLLGAVREKGNLLDWEDDVDISVLLDDDMTWERLTSGLAQRGARDKFYVDIFEKKGFVSISFDPPKQWPFRWERNRFRGEIRTDIAIYRRAVSYGKDVLERRSHKGSMPSTQNGGYGVLQEIVLPTKTIPFLGGDLACPNQAEAYLHLLYGDFQKVEYTYVDPAAAKIRAAIDADASPK